jgi:hypothetical protein
VALGSSTTAILDHAWPRLRARLQGLTDAQHLWEPVPGSLSVRGGEVDVAPPQADPPPVATIAWRTWYLGSSTIDRFSRLLFDRPTLPFTPADLRWFDTAEASLGALDLAWTGLSQSVATLDEAAFEQQLGPAFGPMAAATRGDALLHVADELSWHGGQISLLRDLC